jgi:sigma-B regulation protein RsbU (phosphoserine phosphatase)
MSKVAELVKRLVDFHFFTVFLWNEKTQFLEPQFCQNFGSQIQFRTKLPLGHGICGSVAALRRSIRVPNVHLDPRYVRCEQSPEMSSELSVPLLVKGKLIGVLDLESLEYDAFGVQAEQMISTLASSFAIALENARLYEKVGREEKRLEEDLATARQIQSGLLPDHSPNIKGLEISFAYQPAKQLGGDPSLPGWALGNRGRRCVGEGDSRCSLWLVGGGSLARPGLATQLWSGRHAEPAQRTVACSPPGQSFRSYELLGF